MTEIVATYNGSGIMLGRKITRCNDCKFYKSIKQYSPSGDKINTVEIGNCYYFDAIVTEDGFCAWGECENV